MKSRRLNEIIVEKEKTALKEMIQYLSFKPI